MSILHLKFEDVRRVTAALSDIRDGVGGQATMGDFVKQVRGEVSEPELTYSNPPPPLENIEPAIRNGLALMKEALAKRYGSDYVEDLWHRMKK